VFIAALVEFPSSGNWFHTILYGVLEWLCGLFNSYGVAIILFTVLLRLLMFPLDFLNKYFSKKNTAKMAEFKDEAADLRRRYANNPMAYSRAQKEMQARHGYSPASMCLVVIINLVVSLLVFISVMNCMREVSNYNLYIQYAGNDGDYNGLLGIYQEYETAGKIVTNVDGELEFATEQDAADFSAEVNLRYDETKVKFAWVQNMWRPDTWDSQVMNYSDFLAVTRAYFDGNVDWATEVTIANGYAVDWTDEATTATQKNDAKTKFFNDQGEIYNMIFIPVADVHQGWNGLLLLIVAAGGVSFLSAWVNARVSATKKKADDAKKAEKLAEVGYSMREAKGFADEAKMPEVDPAMMGNVMKVVMPLLMVYFAFSSVAAFALYITVSSLATTGLGLLSGVIVDKMLARQASKKAEDAPKVINPHAKYFKGK
jgi:membrane protein insertase Oxa1/YidC/SpoIIIJ